jgi:hypothetical protein
MFTLKIKPFTKKNAETAETIVYRGDKTLEGVFQGIVITSQYP